MNRNQRREILRKVRGKSLSEKLHWFAHDVRALGVQPLSEIETRQAEQFVETLDQDAVFYHGGYGGRVPGENLLPSSLTGQNPLGASEEYHLRMRYVFVSTSFDIANSYANRVPDGCVYKVKPIEIVAADPVFVRIAILCNADPEIPSDLPLDTVLNGFMCERAQVLEVLV